MGRLMTFPATSLLATNARLLPVGNEGAMLMATGIFLVSNPYFSSIMASPKPEVVPVLAKRLARNRGVFRITVSRSVRPYSA